MEEQFTIYRGVQDDGKRQHSRTIHLDIFLAFPLSYFTHKRERIDFLYPLSIGCTHSSAGTLENFISVKNASK